MAEQFRAICGLADTDSNPEKTNGVMSWCRYNNDGDNYQVDAAYSLVISTPNFANAGAIGGNALNLNNQFCGSAQVQYANSGGANAQEFGPFKGLGGVSNPTLPAGKKIAGLYSIDIEKYQTTGQNYQTPDWTTNTGNIGFQYNGSGQSKTPGTFVNDPDTYNVIMPSTAYVMETPAASTGRRLHWDVATGELGTFINKMYQRAIGRVGIPFGGLPQPGTSDELAAGWWLATGYGLLLNGQLAFAKKDQP